MRIVEREHSPQSALRSTAARGPVKRAVGKAWLHAVESATGRHYHIPLTSMW